MIADKVALRVTPSQHRQLARWSECVRLTYNWAFSEWLRQYADYRAEHAASEDPESGPPKPSLNGIVHLFTVLRKASRLPSWAHAPLALTRNRAVRDVDRAWRNYFSGRSGRPRTKRRTEPPSFYLHNRATVSYEHGRWHIAIVRDLDRQRQRATADVVAVHFGAQGGGVVGRGETPRGCDDASRETPAAPAAASSVALRDRVRARPHAGLAGRTRSPRCSEQEPDQGRAPAQRLSRDASAGARLRAGTSSRDQLPPDPPSYAWRASRRGSRHRTAEPADAAERIGSVTSRSTSCAGSSSTSWPSTAGGSSRSRASARRETAPRAGRRPHREGRPSLRSRSGRVAAAAP